MNLSDLRMVMNIRSYFHHWLKSSEFGKTKRWNWQLKLIRKKMQFKNRKIELPFCEMRNEGLKQRSSHSCRNEDGKSPKDQKSRRLKYRNFNRNRRWYFARIKRKRRSSKLRNDRWWRKSIIWMRNTKKCKSSCERRNKRIVYHDSKSKSSNEWYVRVSWSLLKCQQRRLKISP